MISYAFNNSGSRTSIAEKAMELYNLSIIDEKDSVILGNEKMLIDIDDNITRIMLLDGETNIRKLINFILEKKNGKR